MTDQPLAPAQPLADFGLEELLNARLDPCLLPCFMHYQFDVPFVFVGHASQEIV
jgi:hypothetical protein